MNDFYTKLATTLRGIAADIEILADADLPDISMSMDIQPIHGSHTDEERAALVDAVSSALTGKPGAPQELSSYHYSGHGNRGGIRIAAYTAIKSPRERQQDEEIARLKAELEAARGESGGAR